MKVNMVMAIPTIMCNEQCSITSLTHLLREICVLPNENYLYWLTRGIVGTKTQPGMVAHVWWTPKKALARMVGALRVSDSCAFETIWMQIWALPNDSSLAWLLIVWRTPHNALARNIDALRVSDSCRLWTWNHLYADLSPSPSPCCSHGTGASTVETTTERWTRSCARRTGTGSTASSLSRSKRWRRGSSSWKRRTSCRFRSPSPYQLSESKRKRMHSKKRGNICRWCK